MTKLLDVQRAAPAAIACALTWALVLLALNLIWEVVQLPLYAMGRYSEWPALGYAVLHCTFGDAGMGLATYLIAALLTGAPRWPLHRPLAGIAVVLIAGELYTIRAEWRNVYVAHSWAYAAGMPTLWGIGVAPLAQWLVLPVLALAILRHRCRQPEQRKAPSRTGH